MNLLQKESALSESNDPVNSNRKSDEDRPMSDQSCKILDSIGAIKVPLRTIKNETQFTLPCCKISVLLLWITVIILVVSRVKDLGSIRNIAFVGKPGSSDDTYTLPNERIANLPFERYGLKLNNPAFGIFMEFDESLPNNFCDYYILKALNISIGSKTFDESYLTCSSLSN